MVPARYNAFPISYIAKILHCFSDLISEGKIWGRKKIKIDPGLKSQVIRRYNAGVGTTKLSKFLATHAIEISPSTVWRRLKDWGVELREI